MTITTFEKTPRMSTYLLSFFIGNLTNESINQTIPHQKQTMMLNIWRRRSTEDKLFYMQEVSNFTQVSVECFIQTAS